MLTEDKVTEIFVMADEFCKIFNAMSAVEALTSPKMEGSVITTAIAGCHRRRLSLL